MHYIGFCFSALLFGLINCGWLLFDPFYGFYHEGSFLLWDNEFFFFGADGISLPLLYLTFFLVPLCILYNWHYATYARSEYVFLLVFVEISIVAFFMTSNLLMFFFFFECLLYPFFIMFGIRALRIRKIHSALLFFFYTLIGSFALLTGLIALYSRSGTFDIFLLSCAENIMEADHLLCGLFLFSFVTKIPIVPFHGWLPEAHVEAPTEISVLLAGVILKMGTYGFLRILLPIFATSFYYFAPILLIIVLLSICYASLAAISQFDAKKIIAYASIAHMNVSVLGMCCGSIISMCGSIFVMFGHGIISSGLFFIIGMLYERYGTKIVKYYTGLVCFMPVFSVVFFLLLLGNIGFPLTSGFVGEALILFGLVDTVSSVFVICVAFSIFVSAVYSVWLYNKIFFGIPSIPFFGDLTYREFAVLLPILTHLVLFGFFPNILLEQVYLSVEIYNPF